MTKLFSPIAFRGLTLKNRAIVAPMCQYSAKGGVANDWHLVHLGRFALGGFSLVIAEATAVSPEGRISYADLGLWDDGQIAPLKAILDFLHRNGAAAGIQLAHAGRKAASPLPWRGGFNETDAEKAALGFESWTPVAPSAERHSASSPLPTALDAEGLAKMREAWVSATKRADAAGFDAQRDALFGGGIVNPTEGRADETRRAAQGSLRPSARHPREQAKKLFPSRDFH